MAEDKKRSTALKRLTPNSVDVTVDGQNLRVPTDKQENAVMNMVLASQMRNLIQEQIKKYKDGGNTLTPKELADLAKAARDTAAFSAEVYEGKPQLEVPGEKPAEKVEDIPDFSKLDKPIDIKTEEKKDE